MKQERRDHISTPSVSAVHLRDCEEILTKVSASSTAASESHQLILTWGKGTRAGEGEGKYVWGGGMREGMVVDGAWVKREENCSGCMSDTE